MENLNKRPKQRSKMRMAVGKTYYSFWRYISWYCSGPFAKEHSNSVLPEAQFQHATPLLRHLSGLEMQLQYNKVTNLIYWMTLHTPLKVVERHHHGYDIFLDSNRTQPFGSGATCFYPYGDLMIHNDTNREFQLCVWVGKKYLFGEWRSTQPSDKQYEIPKKIIVSVVKNVL